MLIKRNAMGPQSGFTLIELIVVMMILAILVATAAPKFLNFQVDARRAAANGLKAAIESASQLVYGKAAIANREGSPDVILVGPIGDQVETIFGYPTATDKGIVASVTGVGTGLDWQSAPANPPTTPTTIVISMKGSNIAAEGQCYITYQQAASTIIRPKTNVICTGTSSIDL